MDTKTPRAVVQRTISLGLKTQRYVEMRKDKYMTEQPRWSHVVNQAVEELSALASSSVPELSEATWYELIGAYNGHFFDGGAVLPMRLASDIADNYGLTAERIEKLRGKDTDLSRTIAAIDELLPLGQMEQYAAYQVARMYWLHGGKLQRDNEGLLDTVYRCTQLLSCRYELAELADPAKLSNEPAQSEQEPEEPSHETQI